MSPLRDSSSGCTSPSFFLSSPFSSLPYADLSKQQQTLPGLGGGNGTMKVQSLLYLSIPDGMYWRPKNTVVESNCNCGFIHWKHNLLPDNSTSSGFGASFAYGFLLLRNFPWEGASEGQQVLPCTCGLWPALRWP